MMRNLPEINNLVIKIGSNILAGDDSGINKGRVEAIADTIASIKSEIPYISVVSSGAVAAGFKLLGFKEKPREIIDKQACAATGQAVLMRYYEEAFKKHHLNTAQILVTKYDFSNRQRYLNARATLLRLLELNSVPVINENDTVVVNELKYIESFGDNDNLSALVAGLIDADMLLILSDVDGLYTADPSADKNARHIPEVPELTQEIYDLAGGSTSGVGTGGMQSKLSAARKAIDAGCGVGILDGRRPENILKFLKREPVGTYFSPSSKAAGAKKLWITHASIPQGTLVIDDGALHALQEKHSSLLASGITAVKGYFQAGDVVRISSLAGEEIGMGKVRYSAEELNKIKQKRSSEISELLGRKESGIAVHCDEMGFL